MTTENPSAAGDGRIRVAIADDEPLARQTVRRLLEFDEDVVVVGESSGADAVDLVLAERPDILLLDIQMPEVSGFDVLAALPAHAVPLVIFTTAHDEYAVQAFEQRALDYLLKPFNNRRFHDAMARAKEVIRRSEAEEAQRRLLAFLASRPEVTQRPAPTAEVATSGEAPSTGTDRIAIRDGGRTIVLRFADITWIGASGPYVEVYGKRGKELVRTALAALVDRLDGDRFFRIHRSAVVNLDYVVELRHASHGDYTVLLRDGTTLKLSRSRREELELRLGFRSVDRSAGGD